MAGGSRGKRGSTALRNGGNGTGSEARHAHAHDSETQGEEAQALVGPSVWARLRPRWRWFGNGPIPEIRADGGAENYQRRCAGSI